MAREGPQVLGDYLLIERIGEGGMAEVYRAQYTGQAHSAGPQNEVVVKRIKPGLFKATEFPIFREMFLNEAKLVRSLQHPNLARVHALLEAVDKNLGNIKVPFIVGEYIRGHQLWQLMRIATHGFTGRGVPPPISAFIVREIARGLGHAHLHKDAATGRPQPIIHRDISPENVMVSEDGQIKVIDFGVAKAIGGFGPQTQTGIIKGKLAYMAPEQVAQRVVPATDVFGAGIVLHELLTGRRLFAANNEFLVVNKVLKAEIPRPSETTRGIPKELEAVLMTALSRDLTIRYANGDAFADALTEVMKQVPVLRGTTANTIKRWTQQTMEEGARIANQWQAESSDENLPHGKGAPPAHSGGEKEQAIEITGEDIVFSGLDGQVDPAVRAVVTQGLRTLKPDMLERRSEPQAPASDSMPGMAASASSGRRAPPPPPAPRAGRRSDPIEAAAAPNTSFRSEREHAIIALPKAPSQASPPTEPAAPHSGPGTHAGSDPGVSTAPHPPALEKAASRPLPAPFLHAAEATRRLTVKAGRTAAYLIGEIRLLPAVLQEVLGDPQLARWAMVVAGLAAMVLILLLLLLFKC